jgi:hypothetical protein
MPLSTINIQLSAHNTVHLKSLVPAQGSLNFETGIPNDTLSPFKNKKCSLKNHNESLKTLEIYITSHYPCPRARQLLWELYHAQSLHLLPFIECFLHSSTYFISQRSFKVLTSSPKQTSHLLKIFLGRQ